MKYSNKQTNASQKIEYPKNSSQKSMEREMRDKEFVDSLNKGMVEEYARYEKQIAERQRMNKNLIKRVLRKNTKIEKN